MQSIAQLAGRELKWSHRKGGRREFELHADGTLVATLKFRSAFGTFATAEGGDGCWTFKRIGFWQTSTTIRTCGSDTNLAVFRNNTWSSGGTLEFPNGRKARATTNLWMTKMEFRTDADEPLVRFDYGGAFRLSAKVVVSPTGWQAEYLPLFVLFGWYLAVMLYEDASAVAVITG